MASEGAGHGRAAEAAEVSGNSFQLTVARKPSEADDQARCPEPRTAKPPSGHSGGEQRRARRASGEAAKKAAKRKTLESP